MIHARCESRCSRFADFCADFCEAIRQCRCLSVEVHNLYISHLTPSGVDPGAQSDSDCNVPLWGDPGYWTKDTPNERNCLTLRLAVVPGRTRSPTQVSFVGAGAPEGSDPSGVLS